MGCCAREAITSRKPKYCALGVALQAVVATTIATTAAVAVGAAAAATQQ